MESTMVTTLFGCGKYTSTEAKHHDDSNITTITMNQRRSTRFHQHTRQKQQKWQRRRRNCSLSLSTHVVVVVGVVVLMFLL
jgi:hypothetical protein